MPKGCFGYQRLYEITLILFTKHTTSFILTKNMHMVLFCWKLPKQLHHTHTHSHHGHNIQHVFFCYFNIIQNIRDRSVFYMVKALLHIPRVEG